MEENTIKFMNFSLKFQKTEFHEKKENDLEFYVNIAFKCALR